MSKNKLSVFALFALAIASVGWAISLGNPSHSHATNSELLNLASPLLAIILGFLVGTSIRGPISSRLNVNRILAWIFAYGFLWVHYAYSMHHGNSGGLQALDVVPRVFFILAFVWIAFHAGIAKQTYGWPFSKRPASFHDWYVLLSWGVLFFTIPVFSVPVLGASPVLMAIAWLLFAPHLLANVYFLSKRTTVRLLNQGIGQWLVVLSYAVLEFFAAIRSFPI